MHPNIECMGTLPKKVGLGSLRYRPLCMSASFPAVRERRYLADGSSNRVHAGGRLSWSNKECFTYPKVLTFIFHGSSLV